VEWYYEKKAYVATIVIAIVFSHFFSCVVQTTSVSTTASAITMAVIGLKTYFLWEYRHYRKLIERRAFLYVLMALIVGINFIPVFVVNNVDFSAHIGTFYPI
jgi:membrane associated rhomboid family serine protease